MKNIIKMEGIGNEIGLKMRSAIKAKLMELGCYVDDELPDYVMVMVANKRTRSQMDEDLQLFLGDNTGQFVGWLHQVLKKLQEVTVTAPLGLLETEKFYTKEKKSKDKKDKVKSKKCNHKKTKKKDKIKEHKKKDGKKSHKTKSKHHVMIRPNIPPLFMNIEKESEPSITDIFAGQILKNHGITLDEYREELKQIDKKPTITEIKRSFVPVIDPVTILSQSKNFEATPSTSVSTLGPTCEQTNEVNAMKTEVRGSKPKLVEDIDTMSDDDDDFLTIRTEGEELHEVKEKVVQTTSVDSSSHPKKPEILMDSPANSEKPIVTKDAPNRPPKTLPHIELNLPKRPVKERLGVREVEVKKKRVEIKIEKSPERFTPEREPINKPQSKTVSQQVKSHSGSKIEYKEKVPMKDTEEDSSNSTKTLSSKVSVLERRPLRSSCASVVRVRPRPRVGATTSTLLLKAVADAHKSLLNTPLKQIDQPPSKHALVHPMRRWTDAGKIVIQVPGVVTETNTCAGKTSLTNDSDGDSANAYSRVSSNLMDKESKEDAEMNIDYLPSVNSSDDMYRDEAINIHTPSSAEENTKFIVTMDGYLPNAFLAKKLMQEGLLDEVDIGHKESQSAATIKDNTEKTKETEESSETVVIKTEPGLTPPNVNTSPDNLLCGTSHEYQTDIVIKQEEPERNVEEKRHSDVAIKNKTIQKSMENFNAKKRKASPIIFDIHRKPKETERERTQSANSDNLVTVTTTSQKSENIPILLASERKVAWCRAFPLCRFGSACAFAHPRCKFAAACSRRECAYSHPPIAPPPPSLPAPAPMLASHVVPAPNYKSVSSSALANLCKYYPICVNPTCHYYHPKPCRYGKACVNKLECNFYHNEITFGNVHYPV